MTITFTVPGNPVAKGRPRAFIPKGARTIRFHTPKKTTSWEAMCRHEAALAMAGAVPVSAPVKLHVMALFPVPASWPAWKREAALNSVIWHTGKPDGDNIIKAVKDACNGVLWHDDMLVADERVTKRYSERPRVEVQATVLDGAPSQVKARRDLPDLLTNTPLRVRGVAA